HCGRQVCTADRAPQSRRCATCAQLAAIADPPVEVVAAARAVTGGGQRASRAWRMARDRSHLVVEVDLGLKRKAVFTLRPGTTSPAGTELAQRFLGFSRHRTLDLQPLILTEVVRDTLDSLRRQLAGNIEVQFEVDEDAGVIEGDPVAVKQVLLHLVTNAREAMPKGGTLHVEVRRARLGAADRPLHAWVEPGSYVSVALSDTGVGMDAQTMARVFEPFFTTK